MSRTTRVTPILLALLGLLSLPAIAAEPDGWETAAERSGFQATGSYEETIAFLERLDRALPELALGYFGTSAEGRRLPMVVLSSDHSFTSKRVKRSQRPLVMIVAGIHAGEIDGKDAILRIVRDLARGEGREILDAAQVLLVPIYNVDGHERVSPFNRPNQIGPEDGMGFRTTSQGLDLNRDWLKLDSPEARALSAIVTDWEPHLVVDVHVTDGAEHGWTLTTSWPEPPQVGSAIGRWLAPHLGDAMEATEEAGYPAGPYVALVDRLDPEKGFSSNVHLPRYSTGYFPLRNTPVILVETHARKPYRDRVLATEAFLRAIVAEVGEDPEGVIAATREAGSEVSARGAAEDRPPVVVAWKEKASGEPTILPLRPWTVETSTVLGAPSLAYDTEAPYRPVEVPWFHGVEPDLTLPRPAGYLVLPGWPRIEDHLRRHGLRGEKLRGPAELEVVTARVEAPKLAESPYQGRVRLEATAIRAAETRTIPAGAIWVPADQPLFEIAVQLLEPEAPDSLLQWGYLSSVFERKEYVEARILDAWAEEQLREPEVAAAWSEALSDEDFAADPWARYLWWHRRHPSWDDTVGLLPFFRVMDPKAIEGVNRYGWR